MAARKKAKKASPKKTAKKATPKKATKKPARRPAAKAKKKPAARKTSRAAAAPRKARVRQEKPAARKVAPRSKASAKAGSEGRFVWHELTTPDVAAAVRFYSGLFGWTPSEMQMGGGLPYTVFKLGETSVAGAMAPMSGDPSPPHWGVYCTTPDVDAATARAKKAGATVYVEPSDIPGVGRFSVIQDPQGAVMMPFKELQETPELAGTPPPSTFCWDECLTSDPEAAVAFYEKIFNWTARATDMGGGKYYVLHRRPNDQMSGGIMSLPMPGVPPHWMSHVAVQNLEDALARVESLGGRAMTPPTSVGFGRFALIADPAGATLGIFQGNEP